MRPARTGWPAVSVYTSGMDKVRFGRALGFGTRQAGKALWRAADAAFTPDPNAPARPASSIAPAAQRAGAQAATLTREGKRFGQTVWAPVKKASGVLWLEVTGVFFGLFAATAAIELYRHHHDFTATGPARQHVWFAVAMFVLFGWFTVSSFARARKRSRR